MFDLTCSYLDDDDIDHEAEKQWIFKTLHRLEKEEEIKSLLNDFSKFSSLYDEAVAAGLKKSAVNDYIIISASAPDEVPARLKNIWGKPFMTPGAEPCQKAKCCGILSVNINGRI